MSTTRDRRLLTLAMAFSIGMGLVVALLVGVATAQEPQPAEPPPGVTLQMSSLQTYYLILNTARPLEEIMPALLDRLAELKDSGVVKDFGFEPERSAPGAVPGVRVVSNVPATRLVRLTLPGVLDVQPQLPPPPPSVEVGALAVTGIVTGQVRDASTNVPVGFGATSNVADIEVFDAVSFAYLGCVRYNSTVGWWCDEDADANGVYSITVTAPYTRVKVVVFPKETTHYYASEWYNNKAYFSQADAVTLNQGAVVPNINFLMDRAGTISGTVQLDTGFRLEYVNVDLFDAAGNEIASGLTDSDGWVFIPDLRAGAYRAYLYEGPGYKIVPEWYQDRLSLTEATPITVTGGMTTNIVATVAFTDEPLNVEGNVIFWVSDELTGQPLNGVRVSVYPTADPTEEYDWCATWSDGSCEIWPAVGEYYVRFQRLGYETEYYNNRTGVAALAAVPGAADPLRVTSARINVTAALARATGKITGTVTYQGVPLAANQRAVVVPYDATGDALCYTYGPPCPVFTGTGSTTPYSIPLSAGTYKVYFKVEEDASGWQKKGEEWYNDKPNWNVADVFTLTTGATQPNINADVGQQAYYGCITGTVKDGTTGVGALVTLYADRNAEGWHYTFLTDYDGSYQQCYIPPGRYLVSFSRFTSATTWYRDAASSSPTTAQATQVAVTSAVTTTNVNGYLGGLGACISGKLVDTGGQPASGADFWLWDASDNTRIGFWYGLYDQEWADSLDGQADGDGGFVICGLSPGQYRVEGGSLQAGKGIALGGSAVVSVAAGETRDIGTVVLDVSRVYLPIIRRQ